MLLQICFRAKAIATSGALPAFDLLALSEVELAADELLCLGVHGLNVYFHVSCFSELSPTSWFRALEPLAICQ